MEKYKIIFEPRAVNDLNEIVKYISKLRKNSAITFIPESFDNLKKNGRIGNLKAVVASLLKIKPLQQAPSKVLVQNLWKSPCPLENWQKLGWNQGKPCRWK